MTRSQFVAISIWKHVLKAKTQSIVILCAFDQSRKQHLCPVSEQLVQFLDSNSCAVNDRDFDAQVS